MFLPPRKRVTSFEYVLSLFQQWKCFTEFHIHFTFLSYVCHEAMCPRGYNVTAKFVHNYLLTKHRKYSIYRNKTYLTLNGLEIFRNIYSSVHHEWKNDWWHGGKKRNVLNSWELHQHTTQHNWYHTVCVASMYTDGKYKYVSSFLGKE